MNKESYHNPPSSLVQTMLKPTMVKSSILIANQSLPPHKCNTIFVPSAPKMTKLIKTCVQKSPKFHKLTSYTNEYGSKLAYA
jgi:hypothetical protein